MSEYKTRLKRLAKHWKGAREASRDVTQGGAGLDPGNYIVWLTGAKLTESSQAKALQIEWTYTVARGEDAGTTHKSWDGIESPDNQKFTAAKMSLLGFECDDFEKIEETLEEIIAAQLLLKIKVATDRKNEEYVRTFVNKLLDEGDFDDIEPFPEASDDKVKKSAAGSKDKAKPAAASRNKDDDDAGDDTEEITYEAVMKMPLADLKALIVANELKANQKSPLPAMRSAVIKELGLEAGSNDDSNAADQDGDDTIGNGDMVFGIWKGETIQGKVSNLDEKAGTCTVKPKSGKPYTAVKIARLEKTNTPF